MNIVKRGLFWRIDTGNGYLSKKRFFTIIKTIRYFYRHQDRDGFPIVKEKK